MSEPVGRPGPASAMHPLTQVSPKEIMGMAVAQLQERGLKLGDAMDRTGVRREGIREVPGNTISVPHNGSAPEDQLNALERWMQRDIDQTFEGAGIKVRVQRPEV